MDDRIKTMRKSKKKNIVNNYKGEEVVKNLDFPYIKGMQHTKEVLEFWHKGENISITFLDSNIIEYILVLFQMNRNIFVFEYFI